LERQYFVCVFPRRWDALKYDVRHKGISGFIERFAMPDLSQPRRLGKHLAPDWIEIYYGNQYALRRQAGQLLYRSHENRFTARVVHVNQQMISSS
jgi:hypothetical protein